MTNRCYGGHTDTQLHRYRGHAAASHRTASWSVSTARETTNCKPKRPSATHASLQRVRIARDLGPAHAASWSTGGTSRRACAPNNCSPCASLNNQSAGRYPDCPDGERLLVSSLGFFSQLT